MIRNVVSMIITFGSKDRNNTKMLVRQISTDWGLVVEYVPMLLRLESRPRKMTLRYVSMQPTMIRLFKWGDDIFMYLGKSRCISNDV